MQVSDQIQQTIGRSWWLILLFGIVSTLFGVMALVNPMAAGASLTWAIGILAVAEGVVGLIGAFNRNSGVSRGWMVFYALISLVFGAMAIANPVSMAASIVMVAGAWFLVSGVMRVVFAIRVRKEIDNEWMLILSGALSVIFGVVLLLGDPLANIVTLLWLFAVLAIGFGVMTVILAFRLRNAGGTTSTSN